MTSRGFKLVESLVVIAIIVSQVPAGCAPVRIGAQSLVPDNPRSHYSRYVNWRPGDGETVTLNPPRMSWPYRADWPENWDSALHTFRLQISSNSDCSDPTVDVTCPFNFYNTIPALTGARKWHWRVGYDVGTEGEKWSKVRSFTIAGDAVTWDRSALAEPRLAERGHPRVLFNRDNLERVRALARTDPGSRASLEYMRAQADSIMNKPWWGDFPTTDREPEPEQAFYRIAADLATVCFVWRMTGDDTYAGVKERALMWARYPPGGRSSPEGRGAEPGFVWGEGGDGSEDATQGSEFLALLFDWLHSDLTDEQRRIMIHSLEWRIDHIMNHFSWRAGPLVRLGGLAGQSESHQYESSMDTAVCGLVLYEHSDIGREWFELILNYIIGVTNGFGFDEAWNEGPGYGTSKMKWLMNATLYFDTALPEASLGRNPYYSRIGDFFSRIIPVGMPHNAWGNQANASRYNHLAHFRKLAYLTGEGRFLLNWHEYGGEISPTRDAVNWRPWSDYVLPAYYDRPEPEPEPDTVALFPIAGWAMAATGPPSLRSTFEQGAGVIFQCRPRGGYGHSFNSDSSFQLHAYGQMLNHGGGSSGNQDAYAYHTMSHNTILIDGLGQAQRRMVYPTYGRIVGFARGEEYAYFAGDATLCYPREPRRYSRWGIRSLHQVYEQRALPYLEHFVRHVLFLRGRYFIIYDDLKCSQPATYTWLYHILPEDPLSFDPAKLAIDYAVGDVNVRLQHIHRPDALQLDDRQGLDAFINPLTGEDYREWRRGDILCGHNLWVSNAEPAEKWAFLCVVYPARPGEEIPTIERVDDATVRVGEDVITFDPSSPAAREADFVVDVAAMRPR